MENPPPPPSPSLKPLSPPEWEALFDDFQHGGGSRSRRRERWTSSHYTGLPLLDLCLSTILRKDLPLNLKLHILVFLDEFFSDSLFDPDDDDTAAETALARLVETLRLLLHSPIDGVLITYALREQMMVSTTSIFITLRIDGGGELLHYSYIGQLESLTELLLTVINRPNHGQDRHVRGTACECLRELERAYPCLLSQIGGHLWKLCQSERTHVSQSYVLLLTAVIHSIAVSKPYVSILNTSIPLVPFNVPRLLIGDDDDDVDRGLSREISTSSSRKGLRRAISFLLEWPQFLTPSGMMEFMSMILPVVTALDLQASLLKVQFSGLLYTFDPLMCHSFLMMYSHFLDSFNGQEPEIARRLVSISRESHDYLVFRLLALHWLMGFVGREAAKTAILDIQLSFYPSVYDPLALKSLKLDLLEYCLFLLDESQSTSAEDIAGDNAVKLLKDSIVSVSAFKWLPPWSTETVVAFRAFHKFLVGSVSHSDTDPSSTRVLMESTIFLTLQKLIVDLALEFKSLVPVVVVFVNRFLACHKHLWLGERLLQTFDKRLLPKVMINYQLACYFPIFHRIAENDTVPPCILIELLSTFMIFLVEKHGPDAGLKSWSQGSKVLGICRTMMKHHYSSRLFLGLSRLLAFTCMYFPDLEVRDDARIYLRMLTCIPGKKLRLMLNSDDQIPGIAASPQSSSYLNISSPRPARDLKKSRTISSYIYIERMIPLLVKQSWSLSLSTLGIGREKPSFLESIRDSEPSVDQSELDGGNNMPVLSEMERIEYPREPLRVMDSKISGIIEILRWHFSSIPDFRHMAGFKVGISCSLKFKAEPFNRVWGLDLPADSLNQLDVLPAMYAAVLTFSSSAPYGPIPSYHIPFLLGEPPGRDEILEQRDSLYIVSIENGYDDNSFKAGVVIKLEPREPTPGIIDVSIEANTENGQVIHGQLQSITIGIENMFHRAIVPSDISKDAEPGYFLDLFNALWEACGSCSNTGREAFPLNGGKGVAAMNGTQSVKLLEIPATSLIQAVERYLADFVVGVIGEPLITIVKDRGIIKDVIWKDVDLESTHKIASPDNNFNRGPLFIKSREDEDQNDTISHVYVSRKNKGCFLILIFLPPRFHLLFQMEVCELTTLVRIRTDYWPCLAYIDDYLEALFPA